jgi:hypothetical protein
MLDSLESSYIHEKQFSNDASHELRTPKLSITAESMRIWDRFYQANSSRNKEENSGCGLGLSLVQKIAQIHEAKLEVNSESGKGSAFRVIFNV